MNTQESLSTAKAFILAARLPTLLVGVAPVLLGNVLGLYMMPRLTETVTSMNYVMAAVTILAVMLMQTGANLVNDVKDAERGVDSAVRVGPVRVTQAGLLGPEKVRLAYRVCFVLSLLLAGVGVYRGGWEIMALGVICVTVAYLYTAGPKPLSHLALGEVMSLIFFGPVAVLGTIYLQTMEWKWHALPASLGPGFYAAAMMAINNYRDRDTDREAGKVTLAIRWGDAVGQRLPAYFLYIGTIFLGFGTWSILHMDPLTLIVGALGVAWIYFRLKPFLSSPDPYELNHVLKRTGRFSLVMALVYIVVVLL